MFGGYIRADLLHIRPGDIEHLARMQFNGQFYGIESFNRPSAAAIGKGMDSDKIKQVLLDTKAYFLKHNGYYRGSISLIAGLPYDTEETMGETLKWCEEHWKTNNVLIHPLVIPLLKNDWIILIDPDERILEPLQSDIERTIRNAPNNACTYRVPMLSLIHI